jgi:hypothetical protein
MGERGGMTAELVARILVGLWAGLNLGAIWLDPGDNADGVPDRRYRLALLASVLGNLLATAVVL